MEEFDKRNPVWENLVLKRKKVNLNFLPGKILLSRWQVYITNDASPELNTAAMEIASLYYENRSLPNAKKDIFLLLNK
jgi:hypothetical protein